jgi:hypothetical protein
MHKESLQPDGARQTIYEFATRFGAELLKDIVKL